MNRVGAVITSHQASGHTSQACQNIIHEYPDYPVTDLLVFCLSGHGVGTKF